MSWELRLRLTSQATRLTRALLAAALLTALGSGAVSAAQARGPADFLQALLSFFGPEDASPPEAANLPANPLYPYAGKSGPGDIAPTRSYRTVCVRLCDGYYWPVSDAAPMSRFERDRTSCESSCEQPARLYYQPTGQTDPARLASLDGLSYAALPQAFSYRKSLTAGCRCKAEPWSDSEVERHRQYALDERSYEAVGPGDAMVPPADEAASAEAAPALDMDAAGGGPAARLAPDNVAPDGAVAAAAGTLVDDLRARAMPQPVGVVVRSGTMHQQPVDGAGQIDVPQR